MLVFQEKVLELLVKHERGPILKSAWLGKVVPFNSNVPPQPDVNGLKTDEE